VILARSFLPVRGVLFIKRQSQIGKPKTADLSNFYSIFNLIEVANLKAPFNQNQHSLRMREFTSRAAIQNQPKFKRSLNLIKFILKKNA